MAMKKLRDFRGFADAINECCTCGGGSPDDGCDACKFYHAIADFEFCDGTHVPAAPKEGLPKVGEPIEVPGIAGEWIRTSVTGLCTTPTFTVADEAFEDVPLLVSDEGTTWRRIPAKEGKPTP